MKATIDRKLLIDALRRDLHMSDKVDVLQAAKPEFQPKNRTTDYWLECIDNGEFEDYEAAVADASDPNAARTAYKNDPKPFYVIVNVDSINKKATARMMPKEVPQAAKRHELEKL